MAVVVVDEMVLMMVIWVKPAADVELKWPIVWVIVTVTKAVV